jgi:zinc transporter ZupT
MIQAAIWCLTTAIALASVFTVGQHSIQRRILPWSGGILVGIAVFWVLPAIAAEQGWLVSLISVLGVLLLLGVIDRYVYPICPFCAAGVHTHHTGESVHDHSHAISLAWPLLVVGCLHSFVDGWTIGLGRHAEAAVALSWGATIHKIPESMAVGFLALRLSRSRTSALGAVALVQVAMAAGLALASQPIDSHWAIWGAVSACGFLLLLGIVAAQQEWRAHGRDSAVRTVAPGLLGCLLLALAIHVLAR